jgi:hypothetical protein
VPAAAVGVPAVPGAAGTNLDDAARSAQVLPMRIPRSFGRSLPVLFASALVAVVACSSADEEASPDTNSGRGRGGGAGASAAGAAGGAGAAGAGGGAAGNLLGGSAGAAGAAAGAAGAATCLPACPDGRVCVGGVCLPPQPACTGDDDCHFDTHCAFGACVPYAAGETNSACVSVATPEVLAPSVKCELSVIPPGDAFPNKVNVQATPMVARLGTATPSIVAPFAGGLPDGVVCAKEDCNYRFGIIRILSGSDCSIQQNLGGTDLDGDGKIEWARSSSPVALADLDGDKIPEIVAYLVEAYDSATNTGREVTVAFTNKGDGWKPLWPGAKAKTADGQIFDAKVPVALETNANWAGPSIHDVDDDGVPDIVREGYVIDGKTGVLKATLPPDYAAYSTGTAAIVAQLDEDPEVELVNGAYVWQFDVATKSWVFDPAWSPQSTTPAGWAAIADFDGPGGTPELAVASTNKLTIFGLDHGVYRGVDVTLPSTGGGPPTIADFDGDGLPEVGVATSDYYVVVDPDCQTTPRPGGTCTSRDQCQHAPNGTCPDYVLWSRRSQDHSSRITGSSVFDFEGDGKAEVVYADECFVRVYAGSDGRVLFSQYRSSSTWQENPIVADTDGDFRADLVVGSNGNFTPTACAELLDPTTGVETHFAGTICEKDADCASQKCDEGLCRCTTSAECCPGGGTDDACIEAGSKCAPPPEGTKGSGNTCRASYPHGRVGVRVYEDSRDRWVQSRPIWNQHAYAVTNVGDDGSIPKTSAWTKNWADAKLNNFRQNTPGDANATQIPDLTAQAGQKPVCTLSGSTSATLEATICNRGTAPVGTNLVVGFYAGSQQICTGTIAEPIPPGECATATCTWSNPPTSAANAVDVKVVPNDGGEKTECLGGNNEGILQGVFCQTGPK